MPPIDIKTARSARDAARIDYFRRGIRGRLRPRTAGQEACIEEMAIAAWQLKGCDLGEREMSPEAAVALRPFKQKAHDRYMNALRRFDSLHIAA